MALVSKAQPSIGFTRILLEFILECGVPQGSVIGPRVFTMYSQYVSTIIRRHGLNYHIYADDVQIYISFDPNVPGDAACAIF